MEATIDVFTQLLAQRDVDLCHKWHYNRYCTPYGVKPKKYNAQEADLLYCLGQQARRLTNCKG